MTRRRGNDARMTLAGRNLDSPQGVEDVQSGAYRERANKHYKASPIL
jgi:hypothetical protein